MIFYLHILYNKIYKNFKTIKITFEGKIQG